MRRDLKLLSFILLPVTQILVPAISLIVSLFTLFGWFVSVSFCGEPLKPWKEIPNILEKAYTKFTVDIKRYADNYGHESGIPNNWDGKVYGLGVDPLVIAIAIFLYIFGVVSMSPVILLIFIVKAVPIFVATFLECWKNGLALYIDTIKNYYSYEIFTNYWKALVEYFKLIKELDSVKVENYRILCQNKQLLAYLNIQKISVKADEVSDNDLLLAQLEQENEVLASELKDGHMNEQMNSHLEQMNKQFEEEKGKLEQDKKAAVIDKYGSGGAEKLDEGHDERRMALGSTEGYVEYARDANDLVELARLGKSNRAPRHKKNPKSAQSV